MSHETIGDRIALNAAMLRLFKGEYRESGDRHSDALFVKEGLETAGQYLEDLRATVARLSCELESAKARLGEAAWRDGVPDVPEGEQRAFLASVNGGKAVIQLLYSNRFVGPASDEADPDDEQETSPDSGEYFWTGWFEEACDQCDTFWRWDKPVDGWMPLPPARSVDSSRTARDSGTGTSAGGKSDRPQ